MILVMALLGLCILSALLGLMAWPYVVLVALAVAALALKRWETL